MFDPVVSLGVSSVVGGFPVVRVVSKPYSYPSSRERLEGVWVVFGLAGINVVSESDVVDHIVEPSLALELIHNDLDRFRAQVRGYVVLQGLLKLIPGNVVDAQRAVLVAASIIEEGLHLDPLGFGLICKVFHDLLKFGLCVTGKGGAWLQGEALAVDKAIGLAGHMQGGALLQVRLAEHIFDLLAEEPVVHALSINGKLVHQVSHLLGRKHETSHGQTRLEL
mmetsp:Transcript_42091/g.51059  ORF Transcript_42091/g.51059 Transcript_42091/m.51059 type:complete len:222 (+) Transcript_42091:283-948(+)